MPDPVAIPNEEYDTMSLRWHITASLRGGTPAMRAAGRVYMPQEPGESEEAYKNRLDRSVLTNMYKKTADKLVGKPLKKPVVLEEDVPPEIAVYRDNIDNQGTNLDVFSRNVLEAAIDDGVTHILVDFSDTQEVPGEFPDGSLTLAQEQELGVRPYARHIRAADLIGWKWEMRNNQKVLTQIRILESVKVDINEFQQERRERIRVIEPGLVRVFEKVEETDNSTTNPDDNRWMLIEVKATTMEVIPLVTFYTNKKGFMIGEPLFLDIAFLNVAHWQSDSDQRNILHIARVPILFAEGFGDEDNDIHIEIGSNTFVKAPKGATLKYVEHTGKGIEAGVNDLVDLEDRINMLGLEMMVKRPVQSTETATGRIMDQVEADSILGLISRELENVLEGMLDFFAKWLNMPQDSGGGVEVFKDFGIESKDFKDVEMLLKMRAAGDISRMTFFKEVKRRGLLSDDFEAQDEIDILDIESGGSANPEPEVGDNAEADGEEQEIKGRNQPGDTTAIADGHRHILQEGGKTDAVTDPETGDIHEHDWDEMGIRTTVDDGHSHILLARVAANGPGFEEPTDDEEDEDAEADSSEGQPPAAGSSE